VSINKFFEIKETDEPSLVIIIFPPGI